MTITNIRETRSPPSGVERQEVRGSEHQTSFKTRPTGSGAFPRLLRSEDGFVIAIVAVLVFSAFVVLGGLAVEAGFWYALKRQDQSAADAAALAAAFERAGSIETGLAIDQTTLTNVATAAAMSNGFSATTPNTITVNAPSEPCELCFFQVVLTDQRNTLLGAASLGSTVTIATAPFGGYWTLRGGTPPIPSGQSCLIALGQLTINGQNGVPPFSMPNCIIFDELSTSGNSIVINGVSGSWNLAALVTAGGITIPDGSALPQKTFTQFPLAPALYPSNLYPYSNVTASPPSGNCNPNSNNPQPGILYCSLTFTGAVNVMLAAGLYYTGSLSITNGASVAGTGVTIVLTKTDLQSFAGNVDIEPGTCNASISLTAPGPGLGLLPPSATASQGLLIFQDPTAVNPSTPSSTITIGEYDPSCGTATVTLTGAIVIPGPSPPAPSSTTVAGYPVTGVLGWQGCTEFIAQSFTFSGDPQLDDSGCNSPSPAGGGIGTVGGSGSTGVTINQTNPVEQVFLSQ